MSLANSVALQSNSEKDDEEKKKSIDDRIDELTLAVQKLYKLMSRRDAVFENRMTAVDEAVAEVIKELKYGTPHPIAKPCPASWRNFAGMCLRFVKEKRSWKYANFYCQKKDGFLVWMANKTEHDIIRDFAKMHGHRSWFWIGLFRHKNGSFDWSSGMYSRYRGRPFTNDGEKIFAADSRDNQIDGISDENRSYSYICRFVATQQNSSTTTLLQMSAIQTMNEMQRIATRTEHNIVNASRCPHPWAMYGGMCLLYIYQKRTWNDAQDLCMIMGGNLAWFEHYKEHDAIQYPGSFSPNKAVYDWFWVGLKRDYDNYYSWVAVSDSKYRGDPFTNGTQPYYAATRISKEIKGFDESDARPALCRRILL